MYRLNDRLIIYMWLKERGACERAMMVFDDNPFLSDEDVFYLFDDYSHRAAEIFCFVLRYLPEETYLDCCLRVCLVLVEEYAITSMSADFYRRYYQLRYRSVTPAPRVSDDADLPF